MEIVSGRRFLFSSAAVCKSPLFSLHSAKSLRENSETETHRTAILITDSITHNPLLVLSPIVLSPDKVVFSSVKITHNNFPPLSFLYSPSKDHKP